MEYISHVITSLTRPTLFKKRSPLFLLSHMRANTSLLGHILGSHNQIDGYYEMHIGYRSWKSLIRQKLLYYRDHQVGANAKYLFDKILHDYYEINTGLMRSNNAKVAFSIREPVQTIKSTVHQFRKRRGGHEYCDVYNVGQYYLKRLQTLCKLSKELPGYFYYDADMLRQNPDELLNELSSWLDLSSPLTAEFKNFHFSGKGSSGDHSGRLSLGKVENKKTDYSGIEVPEELIDKALSAYNEASDTLQKNAINF